MKIAYLLLVHTNPNQINQLVRSLDNGKNQFFIHVDSKASISDQILKTDKVHFTKNRISVKWGDFTLIEATLELCREAIKSSEDFDYVILLSGQDYPIKSNRQIEEFLENNKGKQFFKVRKLPYDEWPHHGGGMDRVRVYFPKWMIDRRYRTWKMRTLWIKFSKSLGLLRRADFFPEYYGVSQWFCATREAIAYIVSYLEERPGIMKFFRNTFIPDEILLNTIIMNSPFRDQVVPDDKRYLVWTNTKENPLVFRAKNFDELMNADCLFARKFDERVDANIMDLIDEERIRLDSI
jgi:hypothetical protein